MIRLPSSHKLLQRQLIKYVSRTRDHVQARVTPQGRSSDSHHQLQINSVRMKQVSSGHSLTEVEGIRELALISRKNGHKEERNTASPRHEWLSLGIRHHHHVPNRPLCDIITTSTRASRLCRTTPDQPRTTSAVWRHIRRLTG